MLVTLTVSMLCSLGLAAFSHMGGTMAPTRYAYSLYACLFVNAVARAFHGPANASLWPQLIPSSLYSNAVTWRSGGFQFANAVGPALAGLFIAWQKSATLVYVVDATLSLSFLLMLLSIKPRPVTHAPEPMTLHTLMAGVRFVWQTKVILAAVTLDMFAVLLGGATALLPIYAKDILRVGPTGLGCFRRAADGCRAGSHAAATPCWPGIVVGGGGFRRGDGCVWHIELVLVVARDAGADGCAGQHQRCRAP
jgi:hypothetical protein